LCATICSSSVSMENPVSGMAIPQASYRQPAPAP
jgi:hypothetical protein